MNPNELFYDYNNLAQYLNKMGIVGDNVYLRWVKDIINTKITMFNYENLPSDDLTSEIIERALMFNNFLCAYKSDSLGFIICRYRPGSVFNIYWKPETVELLALNGKLIATNVPYNDIILLRDNPMDIVPFITLNNYIESIIAKEKTLDSIFDWISLPIIFTGEKSQVNEIKQSFKKAKMREPFAAATKGFTDRIEQYDIKLPVELEDVYLILKKYRGMAYASMGIYEVDEKRERVVTSEIQAQNDYTDFVYTGMYNERKRFVEECNSRFGTNIVLREAYVQNQEDNIDMARKTALAEDAGKIEIQKLENAGELAVAKEGGNNVIS